MSGFCHTAASMRAVTVPTMSDPRSPGPLVTAMASSSSWVTCASESVCVMMGRMHSTCFRAASSGMTPPDQRNASLALAMTLLRTCIPSSTTAAAVSSHDVSIPRIRMDEVIGYRVEHTPILFITRKWEGYGGMQQLSRDLWRGMNEIYGEQERLCVPFGVQAIFLGLVTVWRGGHVHLLDAALAPIGWLLKKMGSGKVTLTACGLDVLWSRWWYQWVLWRTLPSLDRVVCISRATAEEVRKRGVAEEKIVVIPPGVWPDARGTGLHGAQTDTVRICRASECSSVPRLLTVGRLVPRKGVPWFVQNVVPSLLRDFPQLQYWIFGRGPEELLIKKIVQEKGLEHYVRLLGEFDDAKREECFTRADLFVMPNVAVPGDMEGFGIVCIEASARGVPVVAAQLEGLPDAVIDGETGRLFESGDPEDCVRVIREVIGGRWDRRQVARATLEHYGWPMLFRRYRDEVFGF